MGFVGLSLNAPAGGGPLTFKEKKKKKESGFKTHWKMHSEKTGFYVSFCIKCSGRQCKLS